MESGHWIRGSRDKRIGGETGQGPWPRRELINLILHDVMVRIRMPIIDT